MDDKSPVGQSARRNVPVRCVTAEARAIRDKHAASQVGQLFGLQAAAYSTPPPPKSLQRPVSEIFATPAASTEPPPPVVQQRSEPLSTANSVSAPEFAKGTAQIDRLDHKSTQTSEMDHRDARGGGGGGPGLGPLLVQIPGASPTGRNPPALVHVTDAVVPINASVADAAPTSAAAANENVHIPGDDLLASPAQQSAAETRRDLLAYRERNVRGQMADTLKHPAHIANASVSLRQASNETRHAAGATAGPSNAGAKDDTNDARRYRQRNVTGELGGLFRQESDGRLAAAAENGGASVGLRVQLRADEPLRRAVSHSPTKAAGATAAYAPAGAGRSSFENGAAESARANPSVAGPRCRTQDARNYYERNYKGHDIFGASDSGEPLAAGAGREPPEPISARGGTPLYSARADSSPAADAPRTPAVPLNSGASNSASVREETLSAAHSKASESKPKRSASQQVDHSEATLAAAGGDARQSPLRTPRCRTAEALSHYERNQSGQLGSLIKGELENTPRAAIRVRAEAVEIARVHRGDHLVENLHSYGTPRDQIDPLLPAVRLRRQTSGGLTPAIGSEMTRSVVAAGASARASEQGSVAGERVLKKSTAPPLSARTPTKKAPEPVKKGESADAEHSAAATRTPAAGKTAAKKVTRPATAPAPVAAATDASAGAQPAVDGAAASETAAAPEDASAPADDSQPAAKPEDTPEAAAAAAAPAPSTPRSAASKATPKKGPAPAKVPPKKVDKKKNPAGEGGDATPKATQSPKPQVPKPAAGAAAPKAAAARGTSAAADRGDAAKKTKATESPKAVPVKRPPRANAGAAAATAAVDGAAAIDVSEQRPEPEEATNEGADHPVGSLERGESVEHLMKPSLSASTTPNPTINGSS